MSKKKRVSNYELFLLIGSPADLFFFSFAKALAQVGTYQQMMAGPEGFRHIGLLRLKPGGDLKITCG